ncbi:MAG: tetratricopeptide repeat-containing sensor histidine kinase [Cyclobacteriaceae bacterium]|nr:tetratricopeptide repeat-containing sensor histidine kinase [Cyclobacteriaceae bacterium]
MQKIVSQLDPKTETELTSKLKEAYDIRGRDLAHSIQLTEQVLQEFTVAQSEVGVASSQNQLGLFYLIRGEFEKAEEFSQSALRYFESANDLKGTADARYNIGSIYYRTDKYHLGLIELSRCLSIYRQLNDYSNQARTLKSMGTIYEYFNDREKAIESYEKSIDASRRVNDASLESNALNPLSGIYFKKGLEKLATETIERSIELKTKTNDIRGLAFALYGRAKIAVKQGRPQEALVDLEKTVAILAEAGDTLGLGMAYNKTGSAYELLSDLRNANFYYLKALELGEQNHVQFVSFKANYNLYLLAKKQGDAKRSLDHLEKYFLQKEQVINRENYSIIKSYESLSKIESLEREAHAQIEKNEIIEKKNAELDSFFYRVSHDLKEPISSLLGLYYVAKMDVKDESTMRLFDMYHSQTLRMNDIVMGLINLTEIKNTEKLKSRIDFGKLVDECANSCRYLPNFNNVSIQKEIEVFDFNSEWAIINTILQNLIENAIKYSRNDCESFLRVTIKKETDSVIMIVQDNGQGIPIDHHEKIFNMFYRATDRQQGSGLGLYILKRAVERLNGTIVLSSTPNIGSTFQVNLPLI